MNGSDEVCPAGEAARRESGGRVRALSGWRGFAFATVGALWVLFALWLASTAGPSAAGEPFRFTPPPEAQATETPTAAPAAATESPA